MTCETAARKNDPYTLRNRYLRSFIKASTLSVSNNIFQFFISLISGILIARVLGPDGKGQLYLGIQVASMASMVFSFGLGPAYLYFIQKKIITRQLAIIHALTVIFIFISVCLLEIFADFMLLSKLTAGKLTDLMLILAMLLGCLYLTTMYFGYIFSSYADGVEKNSIYTIVGGIAYLIALYILLMGYRQEPLFALLAAGVPPLVRLTLLSKRLKFSFNRDTFIKSFFDTKILIKYGIYSFLGNLMMTSLLRIDTFIINNFCDPSALGLYSVAVNFCELLLLVPSAIGIAVFPYLTSQGGTIRVHKAAIIARLSFTLGLTGSIVLAVIGYPTIYLMFGTKFLSAYYPMLILLPGVIALTAIYSYTNFYSSSGKPHINALVFIFATILNVSLNIFFVPKYGIIAAAMISSVTYIITTLTYVVLIHINERIDLRHIIFPNMSDVHLIYSYVTKLPYIKRSI